MFLKLISVFTMLLIMSSCGTIDQIENGLLKKNITKELPDPPPLDNTKDAYANSLIYTSEFEIITPSDNRRYNTKYFVDTINVAREPAMVFGINDSPLGSYPQHGYHFLVESVDQLRTRKWQPSEIAETRGPGWQGKDTVKIKYNIDENGRMTNIVFTEGYTSDRAEKWSQVLKSLKFQYVKGYMEYSGEGPHQVTYNTNFFIHRLSNDKLAIEKEMGQYKNWLNNRQLSWNNWFENNEEGFEKIASRKAQELAEEQKKEQERAERRRKEAARVAEYDRKEAARIAYEKSPAGIKARAEASARYAAKQEARKANGWPSNAVARIPSGSWVCEQVKSAMRIVMDERTGNRYAYNPSDCTNTPRDFYVGSKTHRGGGMYQVNLIGMPGTMYTGSSQLDE